MASKMLIDAAHPEETRVVAVRGNRVEEFDYESASKKQLRGNIYLAKVTRVEPSLQAAFVDYGGNRHGFLAFTEIHPDYYQIPVADRQALLEEEAQEEIRASAAEAAEDEAAAGRRRRRGRRGRGRRDHQRGSREAGQQSGKEEIDVTVEALADEAATGDAESVVLEASNLTHEVWEHAEPSEATGEQGGTEDNEAPERVALTWRHASFDADQTTELHVTFSDVGGETRVVVEHYGWDRIPADHAVRHGFPLAATQQRFAEWWQELLGRLAATAAAPDR